MYTFLILLYFITFSNDLITVEDEERTLASYVCRRKTFSATFLLRPIHSVIYRRSFNEGYLIPPSVSGTKIKTRTETSGRPVIELSWKVSAFAA